MAANLDGMRNTSRRALLAAAVALVPASVLSTAAVSQAATRPEAAEPAIDPAPGPVRLTLPEPTGPYPIGQTDLHLVDRKRADPWVAGRLRELMITVWYPARPGGNAPLAPYFSPLTGQHFAERINTELGLPAGLVDWAGTTTHARTGAPVLGNGRRDRSVVLFSPGGSTPRAYGTMFAEELASRGYVVVTMDHTYEAPEVEFPGGRLVTGGLPDIDQADLLHAMIRTRVQDTRLVIDQLTLLAAGGNPDAERRRLPAGLADGLDLSRLGMFGHSAGGFTTAEAMLVDRRIDAGINLDGSMAYSFSNNDFGDAVNRGLDRPFMLMGAGLTSGQPHTHLGAPEWKLFWDRSTGWKRDLYVAEGEHLTFTDEQAVLPQLAAAIPVPPALLQGSIGTVDPDRIVNSLRAYIPAFFDEHLRCRPQRLLDGPSPRHPDVAFIP